MRELMHPGDEAALAAETLDNLDEDEDNWTEGDGELDSEDDELGEGDFLEPEYRVLDLEGETQQLLV